MEPRSRNQASMINNWWPPDSQSFSPRPTSLPSPINQRMSELLPTKSNKPNKTSLKSYTSHMKLGILSSHAKSDHQAKYAVQHGILHTWIARKPEGQGPFHRFTIGRFETWPPATAKLSSIRCVTVLASCRKPSLIAQIHAGADGCARWEKITETDSARNPGGDSVRFVAWDQLNGRKKRDTLSDDRPC